MQDNELDARAQAAQDAVKGKALYLNLADLLEEEYWRGFMLGAFIGGIGAMLYLTLRAGE